MSGKLDGRVVIVTGAASGQGRATARLFATEGARVVLADLNEAGVKEAAGELGSSATYVHLDIADEAGWASAVRTAVTTFGHLDGLINNAGRFDLADIKDSSAERFSGLIETNVVGTFLGIQAVREEIVRAGGGTIVNTSSVSGLSGFAGTSAYTASKFALRGLTRVAALELGPTGIRVNCVCPGYVDTPMLLGDAVGADDPLAGKRPAGIALGRSGHPDEIAKVNLFLTSDDSSYLTGSDIVVDGGLTAQLPADGRIDVS